MKYLLGVIAILLSACAIAADKVDVPISDKSVRTDVFPHPPVQFPGGVIGEPNVEYSNLVGYRPQLLDIYRPSVAGSARPLVIFIHGGGWSRGDSRTSGPVTDFPALLASLAERGYVVASVNYRLSSEAKFPAQIQDVKAAIRFLRANAAQYGIDPTHVVLWGGSAGAHLAALAATTCGLAAFDPEPSTGRLPRSAAKNAKIPDVSDCVQAAALWYGPFDLAPMLTQSSANPVALLGCKPDSCGDVAKQASPVTYVSAKTPPMLLIHGLADTEVSFEQTKTMAARMKQAGASVEAIYIPDVDHGFMGKTPESTRAANLEALQKTFDFIVKAAPPVK